MAALPIAVVLALTSAHAPQVAPETILAFARGESALDPLEIHDNTSGRAYSPQSLDSAIKLAYELMRDGDDLDLGLLAINQRNLPRLGLTVSSAFDPVISIKAGARVLMENYQLCLRSLKGEAALKCMGSYYNTGTGDRGISNGYVGRVWQIADQLVPAIRDARQRELPLPDAPPPPDKDGGLHDAVHVHHVPSPPDRNSP